MSESLGMSWEDMEVVYHENGALMFPTAVRKRGRSGEVISEKVYVRVPVPVEHMMARPEAREWCKKKGVDVALDPHLLDHVEDLALLAKAIRDLKSHSQMYSLDEMLSLDEGSIRDIKERLNYFKDMLDPRDGIKNEEDFWKVVADVKRKKNLLPLADIVGHELPSFMLRTVLEASRSPRAPSFVQSLET